MASEASRAELNLRLFCVKTQISLVRNVRGAVFPGAMGDRAAKAFGKRLQGAIAARVQVEDLTDDDDLAEMAEVYHGLAPRNERGPGYRLLKATTPDGETTVWCEVMSANHLTFSVSGDFLDFEEKATLLRTFVDALAEPLEFVSTRELGYLTAQPTLVGTGLRIRTWMHLGGLAHFGYLRELCNAAEVKGTLVELERPESTPPGSLVILFNRFSLGAPMMEIVRRFKDFLVRVSEQETEARWRMLRDEPFVFLDILTRAKAVLKAATMMSAEEALDLLSDLRLGLTTGAITAKKVNPLDPHWFDDATERVFYRAHGRALRRKHVLPHDVDTFQPWREEALRAVWMRSLAGFSLSRELVERADEQ